jgi:hypothetical protein
MGYVPQNLYRLGGEEPPNNPPTSARHPATDEEIVGAARSNVQKSGIKSLGDNNTDNYLTSPHTPLLSGTINLMVGGGILGGAGIIGTALGLTSGAVL